MLTETEWHNFPAWTLEDEAIAVTFLPQKGGKICSLIDKRKRREWLIGPGNRPLKPVPYGAVFTQQEMCGWDEMFPTIDACRIASSGMLKRVLLPDHGEVWTMEWDVEEGTENSFRLGVDGKAFPYHLCRQARLTRRGGLELAYTVTNMGTVPFPYLWTAHPQFACTEETVIDLPANVVSVYNAMDMPQWGPRGTIYPWPNATRLDGQPQALNRIRSANFQECHKFYVLPDVIVSWAMLTDLSADARLLLEWNAPIRYLGILVDEGVFNPEAVAALEPSTGFYDDLERAYQSGRATILKPRETHTWQITLSFGGEN